MAQLGDHLQQLILVLEGASADEDGVGVLELQVGALRDLDEATPATVILCKKVSETDRKFSAGFGSYEGQFRVY